MKYKLTVKRVCVEVGVIQVEADNISTAIENAEHWIYNPDQYPERYEESADFNINDVTETIISVGEA